MVRITVTTDDGELVDNLQSPDAYIPTALLAGKPLAWAALQERLKEAIRCALNIESRSRIS